MRGIRRAAALAVGLALAPGCGQRIDVVVRASEAEVGEPPQEACAHGTLPGVTRSGDGSLSTLAFAVEQRALCTCGDYSGADVLRVTGAGSADPLELTVDVAVDGSMHLGADARFDGALRVAGDGGLSLGEGLITVAGDLAVGGPLLGSEAVVEVGGITRVAGRVQLGELHAGAGVTLAPDAAFEVSANDVAGSPERAAVTVAPACDCGDDARLDPDSSVWGLPGPGDADALALACAAYRLSADALPNQLRAEHSALLVIEGDLRVDTGLSATVADGETLDLVVLGNVLVDGPLQLGGPAGGRVRLFVTGGGTIELRAGGSLHGVLHAPNAELVLPAPFEVQGSLLVRRVAAEAPLTLQR